MDINVEELPCEIIVIPPPPPNIYQRLNLVRLSIPYIQKDKTVGDATKSWSYRAVTHDAVTAAVRGLLIEHGVMIVPRVIESRVESTGTTTGKGTPIIRYEARFTIDFVNIDDPHDRVPVTLDAHALDEGDKAPGKAASYATKYAILKLLSIETGEDEEGRYETEVKASKKESAKSVAAAALDALPPARKNLLADMALKVLDDLRQNEALGYATYERYKAELPVEEHVAFWGFIGSKERAILRRIGSIAK